LGRRFYNSDSEPEPKANWKPDRQTDRQYINEYIGQQRLFQVFSIKKYSGRKGHFEEKVPNIGMGGKGVRSNSSGG